MNALTDSCLCVLCVHVCVCDWVIRSFWLQGGAVYILGSRGTFTNCNFTSNSATKVSLEEEHVADCEMS